MPKAFPKENKMKTHMRLVLRCLVGLTFLLPASGQQRVGPKSTAGTGSAENKLVTSTYEKLAVYTRAALIKQAEAGSKFPEESLQMRFEFRDMRTGPIQEILNTPNKDLVTLPFGEVIRIYHGTHLENGRDEQAFYQAKWVTGQYASGYDRQWTIGEVMRFEPAKYSDVCSAGYHQTST
jgi:hypothetical protein